MADIYLMISLLKVVTMADIDLMISLLKVVTMADIFDDIIAVGCYNG